jgi:exopolysaccharide biosynthesis polyprenyl glycosylphosphotransferase
LFFSFETVRVDLQTILKDVLPIDSPAADTEQRDLTRGRRGRVRLRGQRLHVDRLRQRTLPQLFGPETSGPGAIRNATFRRLLLTADILAAGSTFIIVAAVAGNTVRPAAILVLPVIVILSKLSGLYDRDEILLAKTTLDEAPSLFRLATLLTLLVYLSGNRLLIGGFGRWNAVSFWALLFVALIGFRYLARQLASRVCAEERVLIIGNAASASWLATKLARSHRTRVKLLGRVSLDAAVELEEDSGSVDQLGDLVQLGDLLARHQIDRAIVAPGSGDSEQHALTAIRLLKSRGVTVSILPSRFDVVGAAIEFDEVEGTTLLGVRRHGLTRSSRLIKRAFDVSLSLTGLIVLAPALALIAVLIKLDSKGPVFFKQPRMGKDDKPFEIFKFRTMVDGADSQRAALAARNEAGGGLFKIDDDPRITRFGKFLRRTSLDELPQLINVIRGEMSLVGPRPLVLDEDERIEGWDRHRLLVVPPGVTGMWQILGSARIPMDEMVKIDYLYGAHWSLWLDVKILVRTVPFALTRRGL